MHLSSLGSFFSLFRFLFSAVWVMQSAELARTRAHTRARYVHQSISIFSGNERRYISCVIALRYEWNPTRHYLYCLESTRYRAREKKAGFAVGTQLVHV